MSWNYEVHLLYVVRYKDAGNMGGQYENNVAKGSFTRDICDKLDDVINDEVASDRSTSAGN